MNPIILPALIFYILLGLSLIPMGFAILFFFRWNQYRKSDIVIFLDKVNRWSMEFRTLKGDKFKSLGIEYRLTKEGGILNNKGRKLYIYSDNHPVPMNIQYKSAKWLDAETLKSTIKNEHIRALLHPKGDMSEMLLTLGAVAAIAGVAVSVFILVKVLGLM